MTDSTQQTGTALIHAPTGPAIAAVVEGVTKIVARMLPSHRPGKGRRRQRINIGTRIQAVKDNLLMDPDQPGIPLVVELSFTPTRRLKGAVIIQERDDRGNFLFHEDNRPRLNTMRDERDFIEARVTLPGETRPRTVQLCRTTTGVSKSGLMPAIMPDPVHGGWRGGPSLPCMLFWEIDPKTLQRKPKAKILAMPLGLSPVELLDRWNRIVQQKIAHGQDGTWFEILPIENNIGGDERISFTPRGAYEMRGLTCVFNDKGQVEINTENPHQSGDLQIVGHFGGKLAFLDRRSIPICFKQEGERMIPAANTFRVVEHMNYIMLHVVGLSDQVTDARGRLNHGETEQIIPDALALIGGSLKETAPRSVARLFKSHNDDPPVEAMMRRNLIEEGASPQSIRTTWHGLKSLVVSAAKAELTQGLDDIIQTLSIGSPKAGADRPTLDEICGGEITPESIRAVFDGNWGDEENILATWMLLQDVTQKLGFTEWEENSWVLKKAFQELFAQIVKAADHEIPRTSANTDTAQEENPPKKQSSQGHQPRRRKKRRARTGSNASST
jgi:hypothetical protein